MLCILKFCQLLLAVGLFCPLIDYAVNYITCYIALGHATFQLDMLDYTTYHIPVRHVRLYNMPHSS